MTSNTRDIVEFSVEAFVKEIVSLTLDGWAVSPTNPGDSLPYNNSYLATMVRDSDTVAKFKTRANECGDVPKPTRAEILAKAREAKEAKRIKLDVNTIQ